MPVYSCYTDTQYILTLYGSCLTELIWPCYPWPYTGDTHIFIVRNRINNSNLCLKVCISFIVLAQEVRLVILNCWLFDFFEIFLWTFCFSDSLYEYQPSCKGGTHSTCTMLKVLQNVRWPPWGSKIADRVYHGV